MADQTDFKHITVNPAEPDDIVIHAGAPKGDSQSSEAVIADMSPASSNDQPSNQPSAAKLSGSKAPSAATSAYRATTLEDIQGFKMSKTQIAVIIVALAAIVAFVVWYTILS